MAGVDGKPGERRTNKAKCHATLREAVIGRAWFAYCRCGWKGPTRTTHMAGRADAVEHDPLFPQGRPVAVSDRSWLLPTGDSA